MIITDAKQEEAPLIADAILEAVGPEITAGLAGERNTEDDVRSIFTRLAQRDDSQYSYLNTRICRDESGMPMGVCISYDGEDLKKLRRAFFAEANSTLGWGLTDEDIENLPGETGEDEFYLDTLMTLPAYRGKGVARELIRDALRRAAGCGKPLGLLCDTDNATARRLYDSLCFREIGTRPFAGHMMNHLQLEKPE